MTTVGITLGKVMIGDADFAAAGPQGRVHPPPIRPFPNAAASSFWKPDSNRLRLAAGNVYRRADAPDNPAVSSGVGGVGKLASGTGSTYLRPMKPSPAGLIGDASCSRNRSAFVLPGNRAKALPLLRNSRAGAGAMKKYRKYQKYLQSEHWEHLREKKMAEVGFRCECCALNERVLDVHHIRYRKLLDCTTEDLAVLCQDCHSRLHRLLKFSELPSIGLNLRAIQHVVQLSRSGVFFIPSWRLKSIRTNCRPSEQTKEQAWIDGEVKKSSNDFPMPAPSVKPRMCNRKRKRLSHHNRKHFYGTTEAAWNSTWLGRTNNEARFGH